MKKKKATKNAAYFGVTFTVDKSLDKLSGKVLFPEKLKQANEMLSKMKMPLPS